MDEPVVDDDQLAAEALAATPDPDLPDDAVAIDLDAARPGDPGGALLPAWYMPAPRSTGRTPARLVVVGAIVASLVLVNVAGLCVTYGLPEIAW